MSIPFQNDHQPDEAEHWESTPAGIGGLIKKNINLGNESNLITLKKMLYKYWRIVFCGMLIKKLWRVYILNMRILNNIEKNRLL